MTLFFMKHAYLALLLLRTGKATYTIVAWDGQHIGAAGCTCIESPGISLLQAVYRAVPASGVIITQALLMDENSPPVVAGKAALANATNSPTDVIAVMTAVDTGFFNINDGGRMYPNNELRQLAVLNTNGEAAGYTGASIVELYERLGFEPSTQVDVQIENDDDGYTVSIQGNVVTEDTVPLLQKSFVEAVGNATAHCDLAAKLYHASTSVNNANGFVGDVRCRGLSVPGTLAFLRVDDAQTGEVILNIDVEYDPTNFQNPYDALTEAYEAWRAQHPCFGDESSNSHMKEGGSLQEVPESTSVAQMTNLLTGKNMLYLIVIVTLLIHILGRC